MKKFRGAEKRENRLAKTLNRPLAIFLLTTFSLTQSIPTGWSVDFAATNEQGIQQPVVPVPASVPAEPDTEISTFDATAKFLEGRSAILPLDKLPVPLPDIEPLLLPKSLVVPGENGGAVFEVFRVYTGVLEKVPSDQLSTLMRSVFELVQENGETILVDGADRVGRELLPKYRGQKGSLMGRFFGLEGKTILTVLEINGVPVRELLDGKVEGGITSVPFTVLDRGDADANELKAPAEEHILRTQEEVDAIWERLMGHIVPTPKPPVLREGQVAFLVVDPIHSTGGFDVTISAIDVVKTVTGEEKVVVDVIHKTPDPGSLVTMAFTRPYEMVVVDKETLGDLPIEFRHEGGIRIDETPPLQKLLTSDLATNFGLSKENIESWMKEGLIKIEVSRDKQTAIVHIDPSIQHASFVNQGGVLVDPLGLKELPREINYQLYEQQVMCLGPGCLHTGIYLSSAEFQIGSRSYELKYKNIWIDGTLHGFHTNLLSEVNIYEEGREVATASYDYDLLDQPTAIITEELFQLVRERITVSITYHDGSQGDIASRKVLLEKMEDGQYHVQTVTDFDKEGKVVVTSKFEYGVLVADDWEKGVAYYGVTLDRILRTDSKGNLLSTIDRFQQDLIRWKRDPLDGMPIGDGPFMGATVTLADGTQTDVSFSTLEELFEAVRKLEHRDSEIPLAVQEFVDHLRKALGGDYSVEAGRSLIAIYPPQYWVTIHPKNGENSRPPTNVEVGHLQTISLLFSGDQFSPESSRVQYGDMPLLRGDMLYKGLKILASAPEDEPWAPIILMTRIHLTEVSENLIRFRYEDRNWRIVRDEEGNVRLEEEQDIEEIRKKLLVKIEAEVKAVSEKIGLLTRQIEEAEKRWREEAEKYRTEVLDQFVLPLQDLIVQLAEISVRDGVSEKTTLRIMDFIDTLNHYLQEELPKKEDRYLEALRWAFVIVWEMERRILNRYRDDLLAYQEKVVAAETLEELEALADQFPELPPIPMPSLPVFPPASDPREQLKTYLEKGNALLEKAKQEVLPPAVQQFMDKLQSLLQHRVEVEASEVPGRYRIRIFPPDGSIRPLDRMPALIFPGQLHSMSFEVTLSPKTFPMAIGDSLVKVLPKYFEVRYEGVPEVDGAMLYEGMLQLAEPGPQGLPNPIAAISLMAKIQISQVDLDGTLHFSYREESWRIYRDQSGKVILEKEPVEKEIKPTLREQILLKRLGKVIAFEKLTATPKNKLMAALHYQFNATGPGTAELTFTIDPCGGNPLCLAPVFRATLTVNVRVSFLEFALKKTQEVDLKPGKQQIALNLGDGLRINLPGNLKAGNLIGATERRFPSKPPVIVPLPRPKPPVVITLLPKSKPVTPADPKKKKKNFRKNRR